DPVESIWFVGWAVPTPRTHNPDNVGRIVNKKRPIAWKTPHKPVRRRCRSAGRNRAAALKATTTHGGPHRLIPTMWFVFSFCCPVRKNRPPAFCHQGPGGGRGKEVLPLTRSSTRKGSK